MKLPVLLIVFNRLDTTQKVFKAIQKYQPTTLYVSSDGPRINYSDEKQHCDKVRTWILDNIDWNCEVKTLFQEKNLGCGLGPSTAISWFFEQEDEGIILEDDCIPHSDFFQLCEELLPYYRNSDQISIISGCNFDLQNSYKTNDSYFYSVFPYTWGWATWRKNWKDFEYTLSEWTKLDQKKFLKNIFTEKEYYLNWKERFDYLCYNNIKDIWDYQFFFQCFKKQQMSIVPNVNMISNIGFGENATHTRSENNPKMSLDLESMEFPLIHPSSFKRNINYDIFLQRLNYGVVEQISLFKKAKRLVKKISRKPGHAHTTSKITN